MIRKAAEMRSEVRAQMRGGKGAVTVQHVFDREEFTAKARLCARLIIPPAASIGVHQHDGEDEVYYILSGTGIIDDGQRRSSVGPGDAVLTGRGAAHAIANSGQTDLEVLAIIMCYS
jgi:mannose-6-phosphate isomerase-like protein (cupin superfamily)